MLADAVCADERLERFRHTRRELELGHLPTTSFVAKVYVRRSGEVRTPSP